MQSAPENTEAEGLPESQEADAKPAKADVKAQAPAEHRPEMDELQRTFRLQQQAAHAAELTQLALRYPSVKELLEEVEELREAAKKRKK